MYKYIYRLYILQQELLIVNKFLKLKVNSAVKPYKQQIKAQKNQQTFQLLIFRINKINV